MKNREIKFRCFDEKNKVMIPWEDFGKIPYLKSNFLGANGFGEHPDNTQHFLQYTGLKDKNGAEIYEGDIVKFLGKNCEIWYQDFAGYWAVDMKGEKPEHLKDERTLLQYNLQMEVVGNIYQNPELMK